MVLRTLISVLIMGMTVLKCAGRLQRSRIESGTSHTSRGGAGCSASARQVLGDVPSLLLSPVLPLAGFLGVLAYVLAVSFYAGSVGAFDGAAHKFVMGAPSKYMLWGHWFVGLWTFCVIQVRTRPGPVLCRRPL